MQAIHITDFDAKRLRELLEAAKRSQYYGSADLKKLAGELNRAVVVNSREIPRDVITMNSRVRLLDLQTGEEMIYTVVFPEDADPEAGRISVLAPIGTAMLGFKAGDEIAWQVPAGVRRFKVVAILYQPEAAGDYHL